MTALAKLLGKLENDHMARLRHVVLTKLGISPLSPLALFISDRRIVACACQLVLDSRDAGNLTGFEIERFLRMKEAEES